MAEKVTDLADYKSKLPRAQPSSLKGGDGGGTFDDMEPRVAALEKRFDRLEGQLDKLTEKVSDLRVDMGIVKERVSHLPTKGWAFTVAAAIIAATGTIVTLAPKLQQWLGVVPH